MILVTGGLGFIGSHTVRALLDLGQPCLVTQHRSTEVPDFLRGSVDTPAVFASVDVTNRSMVLALRDDHPIDGIVHFVGALSTDPFKDMRDATGALANVLEAAHVWKVKRVSVASAIGVYGIPRDPHPINEDFIVPLAGNPHAIVAQKKAAEIYAEFMASSLGMECVVLRIAGIYGPRYRGMRTFVSRLAHAVARSQPLDLTGVRFGAGLEDGGDWCYVKDCARGIALLQTAPTLHHRIYNVGSGTVTCNREFVAAVPDSVPGASVATMEGDAVASPVAALDIGRLRDDTGYAPQFDATAGILDYVAWLRNGNAH